jgi:hypothetical protein
MLLMLVNAERNSGHVPQLVGDLAVPYTDHCSMETIPMRSRGQAESPQQSCSEFEDESLVITVYFMLCCARHHPFTYEIQYHIIRH